MVQVAEYPDTVNKRTKLTPVVYKSILEAVSQGNWIDTAAQSVGIDRRVIHRWIQIGRGDHPTRKPVEPFVTFSQEIETAVRLNLNIVVIILNDSGYGMIKWKQEGMGFDNFGLDYKNPDFVKYAESYGAIGHRPISDENFKEVLANCLKMEGLHIIDLAVDYSMNHSILNVLLKEKTCIL